ncbi:hypothetical protein G9A89_013264 [Geosiphon pyriformis]|nr:hypothetical protein G9A89_013264 [Geosiphon pyriformis]
MAAKNTCFHIRADYRFYSNNSQLENQYRNPNCRFQTQNYYPNQDQYQTTYLPITQQPIYQPPVYQPPIYQLQPLVIYQPQPQIIYQSQQPIQTPLQNSTQMTSGNPKPRITQNWRSQNLGTDSTQNPNSQNYLSLLITPENATTNNSEFHPPQTTLTKNIPPATITENKSLAAIFPFELKETINPPLFSGAALEEKPITIMYTDAKVDGHSIKLILNSGSAGSIITKQLIDQLDCQIDHAASAKIITANEATKTPIEEIDDFPIEVNGIIVPIKVLIIEATQYQALIGNNWLQNSRHIQIPAMSDIDYNELLPIFTWDNNDNGKEKQREESTWEATINAWTNNNQSEMPSILDWKEKNKEKRKGREENISEETTTVEKITSGWEREYSCEPIKEPPYIPLKCKNCGKKLSSMGAWVVSAIENNMATQKDKTSGTTNYVSLVVNNYLIKECGTTFLVKEECMTLYVNTWFLSVTG